MLRLIGLIVSTMMLFLFAGKTFAEDRLWLVRDGKVDVSIVSSKEDDFAAKRLQRWFSETVGADVRIVSPDVSRLPEDGCLILVGSASSNPLIVKIAADPKMEMDPTKLSEQGYIARRVFHDGQQWLVLAGGGRDGVIHAVADLINWELDVTQNGVYVGQLEIHRIPHFKYRWFWTWDNRMDWDGTGRVTNVQGGGAYKKDKEGFLVDYKKCIDYMADHKFNGLIIWGFLRDNHGGVEAAQELCRYATKRGVRILPGVGTSGYEGYYWKGRHQYNANTWLKKHPELRAIKEDGTVRQALCPSNPANKKWLNDGAAWLFSNFEIGGVRLEMGDYFVCYCDRCKAARADIQSSEPDYYKDMAISHQATFKKMRTLSPDAWLSYATYTGYAPEMVHSPPKFLSIIPEDALCKWTLTHMTKRWPSGIKPMAKHNIGGLHWHNPSLNTGDDYYLYQVRDICRKGAAAELEGIEFYGELSPDEPNAEIFYLAWEAFLWDPDMTVEEFAEQRLSRLYGGTKAVHILLDIIPLIQTEELRKDTDNIAKARELAMSARSLATPQGRKRWDKLILKVDEYR